MNDTIIVALISGICVSIPNIIATMMSNNRMQELTNYKIDELRKDVEKHNKVVERTYILEEDVRVLKTKMDMYHKGS